MVVGIQPVFGLVSALPGFSAAHNERLLIYFLLCIALLAGWGIDDLSAVRLPRPRCGARCSHAAGDLLHPDRVAAGGRDASTSASWAAA